MENNLIVSVSPHVHGKRTTSNVMLDVVIALLPAAIAGVLIFGMNAAILCAVCIASCVVFEFLFTKLCKRPTTVGDFSAVVTGLLLAMNVPATLPIWQAVVGSFIAIIIVKCLFGGLGCNFANPAITARVVMLIAFTGTMAAAVPPQAIAETVDVATYATPLSVLPNGTLPEATLMDMFLGIRGGALGETSAAALLLGGVYLVARKVIFALGCAIITTLIRFYGSYPEGVSFSILCMFILNPYIDKWTMKKPFGGVKA